MGRKSKHKKLKGNDSQRIHQNLESQNGRMKKRKRHGCGRPKNDHNHPSEFSFSDIPSLSSLPLVRNHDWYNDIQAQSSTTRHQHNLYMTWLQEIPMFKQQQMRSRSIIPTQESQHKVQALETLKKENQMLQQALEGLKHFLWPAAIQCAKNAERCRGFGCRGSGNY